MTNLMQPSIGSRIRINYRHPGASCQVVQTRTYRSIRRGDCRCTIGGLCCMRRPERPEANTKGWGAMLQNAEQSRSAVAAGSAPIVVRTGGTVSTVLVESGVLAGLGALMAEHVR